MNVKKMLNKEILIIKELNLSLRLNKKIINQQKNL